MSEGATKDRQSITADWVVPQDLIEGAAAKEVRNVPKDSGYVTEIFREEWGLDSVGVDQVFQIILNPGKLSAWHVHRLTTDRLFVTQGLVKIVLYDARADSPTQGLVNEFRFGSLRPGLVVVPPDVWHGVQNIWHEQSTVVNLVDVAYRYEDPDHWRLPADTPEIPYSFGTY